MAHNVPFAVKVRVSAISVASVGLVALPIALFPHSSWAYFFSAFLLAFGIYELWCFWPRFTLGLGPLTASRTRLVGSSQILLSFDDGPSPELTARVLDVLRAHRRSAIFFVLVSKAEKYPDIIRRMVAEGHEVGLHGRDHALCFFKSTDEITRRLREAKRSLEAITRKPVTLYRPSHGFKNIALLRAVKRVGLRFLFWELGFWDTDNPGAEKLLARLSSVQIVPGQLAPILLLHDGLGDLPDLPPHGDGMLQAMDQWLGQLKSQVVAEPPDRVPWLRIVFSLAMAAGLFWFMARSFNMEHVWKHLSALPVSTILLLVLAAASTSVFQGLRFKLLFPYPLSVIRHSALVFCYHMGNIVLPFRSGEIVRPFFLKSWLPQITWPQIVGYSLIDKLVETVTFIPFVLLAVYFYAQDPAMASLQRYVFPICAVAVVAGALFFSKLRSLLLGGPQRVSSFSLALAVSLVFWIANASIFFVITQNYRLSLGLVVATSVAGAIPGLPAGIGIFEGAYILLVQHEAGMTRSEALAQALVAHFTQIAVTMLFGALSFLKFGLPRDIEVEAKNEVHVPWKFRITNVLVYLGVALQIFAAGAIWNPTKNPNSRRASP